MNPPTFRTFNYDRDTLVLLDHQGSSRQGNPGQKAIARDYVSVGEHQWITILGFGHFGLLQSRGYCKGLGGLAVGPPKRVELIKQRGEVYTFLVDKPSGLKSSTCGNW